MQTNTQSIKIRKRRRSIYETNYERLFKLIPELRFKGESDKLVLTSDNMMDLHVEVLFKNEERFTISLAHYGTKQMGDPMADPEMTIQIHADEIEVLTYYNAYLAKYSEVYSHRIVNGLRKRFYDSYLKKDLNSELRRWLIKLKQEKYKEEE